MTCLWSHSWSPKWSKGMSTSSTCSAHRLHCLSKHLGKILPRCGEMGLGTRLMEIPGKASPCGSDFPQEGEESRSDLLEQGHTVPGERPLGARAGSPRLLCLPVNQQASLGLWPLYAHTCLAALPLPHMLIFQSDKSSLSPSHLSALRGEAHPES